LKRWNWVKEWICWPLPSGIDAASAADRIVNASVAKLGAIGVTAGVYGLAALMGTAGTGTAIGTLSGAAASRATLAWIGGSVFTGTIVLVGIARATGYRCSMLSLSRC
jgi:hypothetical protein